MRSTLFLAALSALLHGCATVVNATPIMGETGTPGYWVEVVNGPRVAPAERTPEVVRLDRSAVLLGQGSLQGVLRDREATFAVTSRV